MKQTRHDQLREAAQTFHNEHPEVWDYFVRFALEARRAGYEHYSAYAIFERIRWELNVVRGYNPETEFKLNNNHRPFYARRLMKMYPDAFGNFFRTREQTSKTRSATNLPPLGPKDYPDEHEAGLTN